MKISLEYKRDKNEVKTSSEFAEGHIDDILDAIVYFLRAITFNDATIISAMRDTAQGLEDDKC